MLREEFWDAPLRPARRDPCEILITLGGADHGDLLLRLLEMVDSLQVDLCITAVVGPFSAARDELQGLSLQFRHRVTFLQAPDSLFASMAKADLAISGGGQALYELACVGCPTVALQVAHDQEEHVHALTDAGIILFGGACWDGDLQAARDAVLILLMDYDARTRMSARARLLVDGQGAHRVARAVLEAVK